VVSQRSGERGFALILALMVLLILTAAVAVLVASLHRQAQTNLRQINSLQARALADAALAETLAELDWSPAFGGVDRHPLGTGWIASRVERNGRRATVRLEVEVALFYQEVEAEVELGSRRPRVLSWRPLSPLEANRR